MSTRPRPGHAVLVAVRFLTRLPAPDVDWQDGDLGRAAGLFPLVGVVVGGLAALVYGAAWAGLAPTPAAVLAVAVAVAVTGGLHEDGLADVADGFFGGYDPARRRQIMHDSRIGVFGAAALTLTLLLRVSVLATLTPRTALAALLTGHVLGRGAIVLIARFGRPADGASSLAALPIGPVALVLAAVTSLGTVTLLLGPVAWVPVVVAVVVGFAVLGLAVRKVHGLSGDVLGATCQLVHVSAMATVAALVRAGYL